MSTFLRVVKKNVLGSDAGKEAHTVPRESAMTAKTIPKVHRIMSHRKGKKGNCVLSTNTGT